MKYGVFACNGKSDFREAYVHFEALQDAGILDIEFAAEVPRVDLERYKEGIVRTARDIVDTWTLGDRYLLVIGRIHKEDQMKTVLESSERLYMDHVLFETI